MKHFAEATAAYSMINPRWKSGRRGVVEFVLRAHNSVNVRNHRKVYSFADSMAELAVFLPEDTATAKRHEYLIYIRNDWMKNITIDGISTAPRLKELNTIEDSYWSRRSFTWSDLSQFSDVNVMPLPAASSSLTPGGSFVPRLSMPNGAFKLRNIGKIGPLSSLR
jgi:hypothetical protein